MPQDRNSTISTQLHYNSTQTTSSTAGTRQNTTKNYRTALLASALVPMLWASGFYVTFVWMAIYMEELCDNPMPQAFAVNSFSLLFSLVAFFPVLGSLSDTYGRTNIMAIGGVGMGLLAPLLVMVIGLGDPLLALLAQCAIGVMLAAWGAPMCAWLAESFKPEIRLTAVAIGYNIAHATLGGFSPAIATYMVSHLGANSPGLLFSFGAVLSLWGLYVAPVHSTVAEEMETETEEVVSMVEDHVVGTKMV